MKYFIAFVFFTVIAVSLTLAQIPNAGFESWTAGNPNQWLTNNAAPTYVTITQSADFHSGSSALKGAVALIYTVALPPMIMSGVNGVGFPLNYRPTSLHGFFKTSLLGGDTFYVSIILFKSGSPVGEGLLHTPANYSSYTDLAVPINFNTSDVPDTAIITMEIMGSDSVHSGSYFIVDDLSFSPAAGVSEHHGQVPAAFSLSQNYPNPFNPTTAVSYALPVRSQVRLEVFNVLGERVATLVNSEKDAGYYTVNWTPKTGSGMYFYRIQAGSHTAVGKMILAK